MTTLYIILPDSRRDPVVRNVEIGAKEKTKTQKVVEVSSHSCPLELWTNSDNRNPRVRLKKVGHSFVLNEVYNFDSLNTSTSEINYTRKRMKNNY